MSNPNIDKIIFEYNNSPAEKFAGLSPSKLYDIIHKPLEETSIVKFHNEIDNRTLDQIPFFKIAEEFLIIIEREKFIKLTPLGALPKKIIVELYNHNFLPDRDIESGLIKLWREQDCISIQAVRYTCEISKLVKKIKGKLSLTKKGQSYLKSENRSTLFKLLFLTFVDEFNWSVNDAYPEEQIGQYGYLFSIYLLLKYRDVNETPDFYADKYLKVFHNFLPLFSEGYSSVEKQFYNCYNVRTFERFTNWFGITELDRKGIILDSKTDRLIIKSIITKVFKIE